MLGFSGGEQAPYHIHSSVKLHVESRKTATKSNSLLELLFPLNLYITLIRSSLRMLTGK